LKPSSRRRRQDYRDLVEAIMRERDPGTKASENTELVNEDEALLVCLESLPKYQKPDFQAERLHSIVMEARRSGKEAATLYKLSLYLRDIFPLQGGIRGVLPGHHQISASGRRKARRWEYAAAQNLWRKDRRRCVVIILEDLSNVTQPPRTIMEPYWANIMKAASNASPQVYRTATIADLSMDLIHQRLEYILHIPVPRKGDHLSVLCISFV